MRPILPEIGRIGGALAIVGTGNPDSATAFQQDLGMSDIHVFTDQARRADDLLGFRLSDHPFSKRAPGIGSGPPTP